MPKTKISKTKKEGGKAKTKTAKVTKKKRVVKKSGTKVAAKPVGPAVVAPQVKKLSPEEEAAFARQPEIDISAPKPSGRVELDRLIEQNALQEKTIFGKEEAAAPAPPEPPLPRPAPPPSFASATVTKVYMDNGEPVSLYRKILLWSSVGLCAVVIVFGWVLTIGGSLGLKKVDAGYQEEASRLEALTEDIKNELEDIRDEMREENESASGEAKVPDAAIEDLAEEIKNATTTEESVGEAGRDIFSPPSSTEEITE